MHEGEVMHLHNGAVCSLATIEAIDNGEKCVVVGLHFQGSAQPGDDATEYNFFMRVDNAKELIVDLQGACDAAVKQRSKGEGEWPGQ